MFLVLKEMKALYLRELAQTHTSSCVKILAWVTFSPVLGFNFNTRHAPDNLVSWSS